MVDGLPANVSIGIVPLFCLSSPAEEVPVLLLVELILSLLVMYNSEFLDNDFGTNQRLNIDYQKRSFSCNPDVFHVSSAKRLSRLGMERELGITAGWLERKRISHCDSIPLLEIHLNHYRVHLFLHFLQLWGEPVVSWLSLNFFTENSSTRISWALSHFVHTSYLSISKHFFLHR